MKEDLVGSIYKEGPLKSAKNEEAENMTYSTARVPQFSGWSSRQRSVGIYWIKTHFYDKRRHGGLPQIQKMTSWRVTKISQRQKIFSLSVKD